MADNKNLFLIFPEILKRDTQSPTSALSFDDLGDFIEEREKVKRFAEKYFDTELKVDYSQFSNHVFFDVAESKFNIAKNKILDEYPYNGTLEEKDAFHLTGSGYENHIFDTWPRHVGYVDLSSSNEQFITASDATSKLYIGSSSFYVSTWIRPKVSTQNIVLQIISSSVSPDYRYGCDFYLSGATDPHVKFTLYSGSAKTSLSSSYSSFTASFNNIAVMYDKPASLLSLYVNNSLKVSGTVNFGPIETANFNILVGSGSNFGSSSFDFYSGSVNEVRVLLTASELFHLKNYNRPLDSEDYVRLNYRFNEGTVGTSSIDSVVIDYSKSGLHGIIKNYSNSKMSGSVMLSDPGDPILYNFHSRVISFTSSLELTASLYDKQNNAQIFNYVPEGLLLEDEETENLLRPFILAMARFFDEIKLYIDQFDNLKVTNYDDLDESPDLMLPLLKKYFGWQITDHFNDSDPLNFFFGENVLSTGSLETPLFEIRNNFWRRILNNLPYLLKTKGKRHNLDAFLNVLGINKENINIKEYGFLPGTAIQDTRIHKEKVFSLVGIGTGSLGILSSSYAYVRNLITDASTTYTVENLAQLPFISASYSGTLLTGAMWQMVNTAQNVSYSLLWNVPSVGATVGKFILTGSDGQNLSSSQISVFDGDIVYVAAGLDNSRIPFIEVRTIDGDTIDFSASYTGPLAFSGVFTGSNLHFVMGANSGSLFRHETQGYYGEYRVWRRKLSGSEFNAHALHFENVGINNPLEVPNPLRGHWPLGDNKSADGNGAFYLDDFSRNSFYATGSNFAVDYNPFHKFLYEYNYLSPSLDLRWSQDKVRIRNKSSIKISEIASDNNELSLEFNLIDSLNKDIVKIFSTLDLLNDYIGKPIYKYRDEYSDLESLRRTYFARLSEGVNFNKFFGFFKWFDNKISESIKQLLPARVKFIGGEQVIESHMLERPRYKYQYPVFRTPPKIPENVLSGNMGFSASFMGVYEAQRPFLGTNSNNIFEKNRKFSNAVPNGTDKSGSFYINPHDASVVADGFNMFGKKRVVTTFGDGEEPVDKERSWPYNDLFLYRSGTNHTISDWSIAQDGYGVGNFSKKQKFIADSSGTMYLLYPAYSYQKAVYAWIFFTGSIIDDNTISKLGTGGDRPSSGTILNDYGLAYDIAIDSSGAIYVCGAIVSSSAYNSNSEILDVSSYFTVRKSHISSSNLTSSWSTCCFDLGLENSGGYATAIAIDPATDHIYVAGGSRALSSSFNWLVKKSTDYGVTWSNIFSSGGMYISGTTVLSTTFCKQSADIPLSIKVQPGTKNVFVTGYLGSGTFASTWRTIVSLDSGSTWNTSDTFSGGGAFTSSVGQDIEFLGDNIFVGGHVGHSIYSNTFPTPCYSIIRSSSDFGQTWDTVYQSELTTSYYENRLVFSNFCRPNNSNTSLYALGQVNSILLSNLGGVSGSWFEVPHSKPNRQRSTGSIANNYSASFGSMLITNISGVDFTLVASPWADFSGPSDISRFLLINDKVTVSRKNIINGNTEQDIYTSNNSLNFKNEYTKRLLMEKDRDNL